MAKHRILLVDDQHEVRRMLRTGIETLGDQYQVLDLPSAEEAMLVISGQPVDLLICDVRLPGMSGLELRQKIQHRQPNLKVILITGLTDAAVHKQVAEAGAQGFFTKPIVLCDFLDAVERLVGEVKSILPQAPVHELPPPGPSLANQLTEIRKKLGAEAVLLVDDQGKMIAEAGTLPELAAGSSLLTTVMMAFSTSLRLSQGLGQPIPEDLLFVRAARWHLALAHVGLSFGLLAAGPADMLEKTHSVLFPALAGLHKTLEQMGAPMDALEKTSAAPETTANQPGALAVAASAGEPFQAPEPVVEAIPVQVTEEDIKEFEALFGTAVLQTEKAHDLDSFWDKATQGNDPNDIGNASAISYEQARKLGLAPEEKDKKP